MCFTSLQSFAANQLKTVEYVLSANWQEMLYFTLTETISQTSEMFTHEQHHFFQTSLSLLCLALFSYISRRKARRYNRCPSDASTNQFSSTICVNWIGHTHNQQHKDTQLQVSSLLDTVLQGLEKDWNNLQVLHCTCKQFWKFAWLDDWTALLFTPELKNLNSKGT